MPVPAEPAEEPVELLYVRDLSFGPVEETLYQDARALLRNPSEARSPQGLVLGLTLVLFVASMWKHESVRGLVMLVGVLFFHELGHWAGMQWFGYRDVKMFFIPFFGAAVSGKKEGGPQWQQAIVLLLGPLPGILVGCVLLGWNLVAPHPLVREVAAWLVGINAFNLLPLVPLDGGRLLNLVIFSRQRALESVFLVLTSLGVIGLGLLLRSPLFAILGLVGLGMAPVQYQIARAAEGVRKSWPSLPPRIADATEPQLRDLFRGTWLSARQRSKGLANVNAQKVVKPCVNMMKSIHERAVARPCGPLISLSVLAAYGAGFVLSIVSVVLYALQAGRHVQPH